MTVVVRPAREADIPALMGLITLLAAHHGDPARPTAAFIRRHGFTPHAPGCFLVAEYEGMLAGYALCRFYHNFELSFTGLVMDHLHIMSALRRRGVGRALIKSGIALGLDQDCTQFTIAARKDNPVALALYRSLKLAEYPAGRTIRFTANLEQMQQLAEAAPSVRQAQG